MFANGEDGHCASEGRPSRKAVTSMGDKSPKAKDRAKKQETAHKDQKKAMAVAKAPQAAAGTARKTK
jgi:hypothetical protein